MMEPLFIRILNMSLTGSVVIVAVLSIRLLLKKAPKIFSYCLWAAVLFRLLCPVSFPAAFSPLRMLPVPSGAQVGMELEFIPQEFLLQARPKERHSNPEKGADTGSRSLTAPAQTEKNAPAAWPIKAGTFLWLLGIAVLSVSSAVSFITLKRRLKTARWERENIYVAQGISTPFVIGILHPAIYLPCHLMPEEKEYVLLHEQIHLKRGDHILKLLSFFALCLHWFNPFVWAAFFYSGKDMEMSCDEAVIRRLGQDVKKEYSSSLLSMATGKPLVGGTPLAFGEGDTTSRIKNILHYKKPAAIVVATTAILSAAAIVLLVANPSVHAKAGNAKKKGALANSANASTPAGAFDGAAHPDRQFYYLSVRSIAKSARAIDSYVIPLEGPFADGDAIVFDKDCQFMVNESMDGTDNREVTFGQFAGFIENSSHYLNKPCLLGLEGNKVKSATLQSAWYHFGITPLTTLANTHTVYDSFAEDAGEAAFYREYSPVFSETLDIADSKGTETIAVYTKKDGESGVVLFKDAHGKVLASQDASTDRVGWHNIYAGSTKNGPFLLNVHIEDRWNYGVYSYHVYRLDKGGNYLLAKSSEFEFHLSGSSQLVYDDTVFQTWIAPMEYYLKNSHLLLSTQDGKIRTAKKPDAKNAGGKNPDAKKYSYAALSLKDRAIELSASDNGILRFLERWYGKENLSPKTVKWLAWYNSLPEADRLAVNSVPPELVEMAGVGAYDAAATE